MEFTITHLILTIVVILLIIIIYKYKNEGFQGGLNQSEKEKMANDILNKKELFSADRDYKNAKTQIKWLDPVTYHDARNLFLSDRLTKKAIMNALH